MHQTPTNQPNPNFTSVTDGSNQTFHRIAISPERRPSYNYSSSLTISVKAQIKRIKQGKILFIQQFPAVVAYISQLFNKF